MTIDLEIFKQYDTDNLLIYDGDCPVCNRYAHYMRFQEIVGPVQLIDARMEPALVKNLYHHGMDIDKGMVMKLGYAVFFGSECMYEMARISDSGTVGRRIYRFVFKHQSFTRNMYPFLRFGRSILLRLKGVKPIRTDET